MASRQRKSLPDQSFENGEASGSRNVPPPLFLDTGGVRIKNEEEEEDDELFGGSELSEDDQQDEQDELLQDEQLVAAGLNGFADGHTNNNSNATASTSARKTAPKPRKSASSSKARYELREHLDAPRSLTLSCEILMKRVTSGTVDVNPEYQRETVWTAEKQSALIDSIFRRYYVPPILFSKVQKPAPGGESKTAESNRRSFKPTFQPPPKKSKSSQASGNKRKRKANDDDDDDFEDEEEEEEDDEPASGVDKYVCIDGKQRLSSIINFMNNHIPVIDPKTKRKYYFRDEPVVKKQGIPLKYRKVFEDSQITVVEYSNLNAGHEREMFARVQMGMTLSAAEKLKAQPGEWASFFREMASKYMKEKDDEDNPMLGSIVDTKRGNDYKCIIQFGLIVIKSKTPNFAPMTNELSKWGKTDEALEPIDKKLAKGIEDALILFTDLLQKGDEGVLPEARWDPTKPTRKNLAPIEWVYVAVFIWTVGSKLTKRNPKQLETSLKKIRRDIRDKYPDVMWKAGIAKDYRESIKNERTRLNEAGILGSSDKKKPKS